MKNVGTLEMSSSIHDQTIIVCNKKTKNGKEGINVTIKALYNKNNIFDDNLDNNSRDSITYNALEELKELAKTSPKKYVERLILEQFGKSLIIGEEQGSNHILPNRFQRFYDSCIKFYGEEYTVYFTDLAIKYFDSLINKLRQKRIQEGFLYAEQMVISGKASHLKISLSKGFDFSRINECKFCKNENEYLRYLHPKNTLYYNVSQDENCEFLKEDLQNIMKLLTMYSVAHGGFHSIKWDNEDAVAYARNGGSVMIEGYDLYKEAFQKIHSLIGKK